MRIVVAHGRSLLFCLMLGGKLLNAQTSTTNNQVEAPVYQIDAVPQQLFFRGTPIQLRVQDLTGSTFSVETTPTPVNKPTIDPAAGLLSFSPAPGDAGNFLLTIISKHADGTSVTKKVKVSAFSNLPPEYTLVSKARKRPADDDKQYITVSETEDAVHRRFNNQPERKLVNVVISGKTVVFDKSNDVNGLMTRLNGRQDVETLGIFAETLIFRSQLNLPATDVSIVARTLRFEDLPDQPHAAIITSPNSLDTNPGLSKNGTNGLQAGSVKLAINNFWTSPGGSARFILTGGNGQDAGLGKTGDPGSDMQCFNNIMLPGDTCIVHIHQYAGPTSFGPDNTWPGNGGDATPPGAPGAAGNGGDFISNIDGLNSYVTNSHGQPGKTAQHVDGGRAGLPQHAQALESIGNHNRFGGPGPCPDARFNLPCSVMRVQLYRVENTHDSLTGKGADAPSPPDVHAHAGNLTLAGSADDWLHPMMLRPVLNQAQDAYLSGDVDYTQSVLDDYEPVVNSRLSSWDANASQRDRMNQINLAFGFAFGDQTMIRAQIDRANDEHNSLVQVALEMESISLKLRSNLDYFGHPAGWVPQLSFAAALRSYSDEVKRDIPILYLAYYVQESSADRSRHIASLQESVSQLQSDVKEASDDFNNVQAIVPGLEEQGALVQHDIDLFQEEVVNRKNELMARAEQVVADRNSVPFWKEGLGVLSAVASVCPVGQPVIGAVGAGLEIVAKAGDQGIVETAEQLGSLAGDFTRDKIRQSVDQYHAQIALLDPSKAKDAQSYVKGLVPLAQGLAKEYQAASASLQAHKASSDEVQKESAQLEADDSNLADLSEHLTTLNLEKQAFDNKLMEALTKASSLSSTIMSDWRSIDATNRALSSATGALDHEAVQEVAEFGRRTRDRLLLFQYYLAKAYEYRFLQPYPGDFNLDRLLDRLAALTAQPHDEGFHPLSPDEFKHLGEIYNESVQEVVNAAVSYLETHPKPQQASYPYSLNAKQLATLNRDGILELDLGHEIPHFSGEENRRLEGIKVAAGAAAAATDNSQPEAIRINFSHGGTTTLRSNKQSYRFDHRRGPDDQPFEWAGTLDGAKWTPDKISPEYIGTLKQLLKLGNNDASYNELFAYPGLESVISIAREGGDAQALTALKLTILYDYDKPAEPEVALDVIAPQGLQPLTDVDARDNSGRSLGQGSFTRFYPRSASVTLSVPPQFGAHRFVAWHITGVGAVTTPTVTITMTRAIRAEMEYSQ